VKLSLVIWRELLRCLNLLGEVKDVNWKENRIGHRRNSMG
jgi:hypothetical protein